MTRWIEAKQRRHRAWLLQEYGIDYDDPHGRAIRHWRQTLQRYIDLGGSPPYSQEVHAWSMMEYKAALEAEGFHVDGPFPVVVPSQYRFEVSWQGDRMSEV